MGEELGNYVHQNIITLFRDRQTHTSHCPRQPPGRVSGQTDRHTETVYMGEELGNYVHQNKLAEI